MKNRCIKSAGIMYIRKFIEERNVCILFSIKDEIYFWPQKSLVWILTAALLIKLFFSLFFPQTSIYAKGNNIEITQEALEEYTERYTVTGYSENAEEMAYNDLVKRKALYQKALNKPHLLNSWMMKKANIVRSMVKIAMSLMRKRG